MRSSRSSSLAVGRNRLSSKDADTHDPSTSPITSSPSPSPSPPSTARRRIPSRFFTFSFTSRREYDHGGTTTGVVDFFEELFGFAPGRGDRFGAESFLLFVARSLRVRRLAWSVSPGFALAVAPRRSRRTNEAMSDFVGWSSVRCCSCLSAARPARTLDARVLSCRDGYMMR